MRDGGDVAHVEAWLRGVLTPAHAHDHPHLLRQRHPSREIPRARARLALRQPSSDVLREAATAAANTATCAVPEMPDLALYPEGRVKR